MGQEQNPGIYNRSFQTKICDFPCLTNNVTPTKKVLSLF